VLAPAPAPAPAPPPVFDEPAADPSAYEEPAQEEWAAEPASEEADELPYAGGVTVALDAAVEEGYYDEDEEEDESASPFVLILGWVLFGVAVVGIGVMAYFLKVYHKQLKDAGDPVKMQAENTRLRKQLNEETQSVTDLTDRRGELVAENDSLTVKATDLERELAKAKAAERASTGKVAGLEGQLEVSDRAASDLRQKVGELEEKGRSMQADGTQALSEVLAGRHTLRSIELLSRPARWGEALAQLNKAVRSGEDLKEARWLRGSLLVKLRQPDAALQDFKALDELARKENAAGHVKALVAAGGVCRTQLGDQARAREFYRSAAKAAASSPYGKLAQARLDVLDGRVSQARQALVREIAAAEASGEDYAPFCVLLAEILAGRTDSREEAIRLASKAIVADPLNARALDIRAGLLIKESQIEQAAADLMRAKEVDPFDGARLAKLGGVLADMGRHEQAESILSEALKTNPDSAEAKVALGRAMVGLGNYAKAIELASAAMKGGAGSGTAYLVRGEASIALGQYREGLRDLGAAIGSGQDDPRARIVLARTHATAGTDYFDPEKALMHARAAADLTNRRNPEALAVLGMANAAAGDFARAATEMGAALTIAPQNETYRKLLLEYRSKAR
jgi:tetratricopeptide (TPR) repeat protein